MMCGQTEQRGASVGESEGTSGMTGMNVAKPVMKNEEYGK